MSLTLTVGATNQTAYILADSLSLRLTTFDFGLIDPAVIPALGNTVTLASPAWTGSVTSVSQADPDRGAHKFISITATNATVASASAAPFGLSNAPNGSTTYGYQGLTVRHTTNSDGTTQLNGSLTLFQAGLWPAMTFQLTSPNFGYAAQSFSVTNVT